MKTIEAIELCNILSKLSVLKITGSNRSNVIQNYLMLNRYKTIIETSIEDLRKYLFKDNIPEASLFKKYVKKYKSETNEKIKKDILMKINNECSSIIILDEEFNSQKKYIESSEAELNLKTLDRESFIKDLKEQNISLTQEELSILNLIF